MATPGEHPTGGAASDSAVRLSQCIKVMVGQGGGDAASQLTKSAWGSGSGRTSLP